eukprot:scaffold321751_cov31-Tisochrysis_lutea.AAC.2
MSTALGGILGGEPRAPYPSCGGTKSSHLSPGRMSWSASVQPGMTRLGEKLDDLPRAYDESKMLPSVSLPS